MSSIVPQILRDFFLSRMEPFIDENSLFQRALSTASSWRNDKMADGTCIKQDKLTSRSQTSYSCTFTVMAKGFSTAMLNTIWKVVFPRLKNEQELSATDTSNQSTMDFDPLWINTCISTIYCQLLNQDLLALSKDSLEVLRLQSKILQGLQDSEVIKLVKSLIAGFLPSGNEGLGSSEGSLSVPSLLWRSGYCVWKTTLNGLGMNFSLPWPMNNIINLTSDASDETTHPLENPLTISTLLLYEAGTSLSQALHETSQYTITSTTELINNAVLLFVPMELLHHTTSLLKSSLSLAPIPVMEVLYELFQYVQVMGLDVMEDIGSLPELNYVVIHDDDFHFVVNIPTLKRPILFVGVR